MEYLRADERFNILEEANVLVSGDATRTSHFTQRRGAYDGQYLKSYEYDPHAATTHHGTVEGGPGWLSENDLLNLAGFPIVVESAGFYEDRYASGVHRYRIVGRERVNGRDSMKLEMVSPYKPGQQCHSFFWIAEDQGRLLLMKYNSHLAGDPNSLLYEKRYHYGEHDYAGNHPFPDIIECDRYRINHVGERTLLFQKRVAVQAVEINGTVADEEFQYAFPQGTYVQDFVAKVSYTVGDKDRDLDEVIQTLVKKVDGDRPLDAAAHASRPHESARRSGDEHPPGAGKPQSSLARECRHGTWNPALFVVGVVVSAASLILYIRGKGNRRIWREQAR